MLWCDGLVAMKWCGEEVVMGMWWCEGVVLNDVRMWSFPCDSWCAINESRWGGGVGSGCGTVLWWNVVVWCEGVELACGGVE